MLVYFEICRRGAIKVADFGKDMLVPLSWLILERVPLSWLILERVGLVPLIWLILERMGWYR